jgi:hypothetical protein
MLPEVSTRFAQRTAVAGPMSNRAAARHPADDRLHHLLANIHRKRHDPPTEASVRLSSTDAPLDMGILAIILILY